MTLQAPPPHPPSLPLPSPFFAGQNYIHRCKTKTPFLLRFSASTVGLCSAQHDIFNSCFYSLGKKIREKCTFPSKNNITTTTATNMPPPPKKKKKTTLTPPTHPSNSFFFLVVFFPVSPASRGFADPCVKAGVFRIKGMGAVGIGEGVGWGEEIAVGKSPLVGVLGSWRRSAAVGSRVGTGQGTRISWHSPSLSGVTSSWSSWGSRWSRFSRDVLWVRTRCCTEDTECAVHFQYFDVSKNVASCAGGLYSSRRERHPLFRGIGQAQSATVHTL